MKHWILLLAVIAPTINATDIYKCTENGKITFSEHPCGETVQILKINPHPSLANPSKSINDYSERKSY
jgi:hypothetical protein